MSLGNSYPYFFNQETVYEDEKKLFESIMTEAVVLYGAECVYIPVTKGQIEPVFGESIGKLINEGIPIRMAVEQIDSDFYPEDAAMFSKFGLTPNVGEATFHVTKPYIEGRGIIPQANDLIFYKKVSKMFEITYVNLQPGGFRYKITAQLYNYDHPQMDTTDITDTDILSIDTIDGLDQTSNNTPIEEVATVKAPPVDIGPITNPGQGDGLFG